jgi:hypothetical protein
MEMENNLFSRNYLRFEEYEKRQTHPKEMLTEQQKIKLRKQLDKIEL